MGRWGTFIRQLRRRRVFRVAGIYIVGSWVALQVADLALESLGFPATALVYVWFAVLIGFPLALVFGWLYDVTPEGIVRTPAAHVAEAEKLPLRWPDYAVLGALALIAGIATYNVLTGISLSRPERPDYYNSLAVLPLENLSGPRDYFSAGMHDALITNLSKIPSLRVTSRTSTIRVDKNLTLPMIGTTLGVNNIVEGSVTREGNRVRIIVQLIDAANDAHIWAESYERELSSVLTVQREIARAIASAIEIRLTPEEERYFSVPQPVNPVTYEAYLKGMFQLRKGSRRGYRQGIEILTEAVENDPGSALAFAGLAYGYGQLGHSPFPVEGAYPKARAAAQKALELDPTLAEAHLAVAMYQMYYEWDFQGAEESLVRALDLNPSLVDAHYHYAWLLELLHRDEEALAHGERTKQLNPLSAFYSSWLADQYRDAGMYDKAVAEALTTLELSPNYPVAWVTLGKTFAEMGRYDEAIQAHEHLKDNSFWGFARGYSFAMAGRHEDAIAIADAIGKKSSHAYPLTLIYATIGDREQTFRWLEVAREQKIPWYPWLVAWFPQMTRFNDEQRLREMATELNISLRSRNDL